MREVFEDLCVEYDGANTGLTGELDQAALYGVLNRILAFRLELVALSRLDDEPPPPLSSPATPAAATPVASHPADSELTLERAPAGRRGRRAGRSAPAPLLRAVTRRRPR
jgi:hypothetical protein